MFVKSLVALLMILSIISAANIAKANYNLSQNTTEGQFVDNQFIVKYKINHDPQHLEKEIAKQNMKNNNALSRIKHMLKMSSSQSSAQKELSQLQRASRKVGVTKSEIIIKNTDGLTYLYTTNGKNKYDQIVTIYEKLDQVEYVEPNYIYTIQNPVL